MTLYHVVESAVVTGAVATALALFVRRVLPRRAGGGASSCGGCSGCGSTEAGCASPPSPKRPAEHVVAMPTRRR